MRRYPPRYRHLSLNTDEILMTFTRPLVGFFIAIIGVREME